MQTDMFLEHWIVNWYLGSVVPRHGLGVLTVVVVDLGQAAVHRGLVQLVKDRSLAFLSQPFGTNFIGDEVSVEFGLSDEEIEFSLLPFCLQ